MTQNSCIILLDVGGTAVKSALGASGEGALEGTFASTPMPSGGNREEISAAFREAVNGRAKKAESMGMTVAGISLAIPGPFDYNNGVFLMKHKFASVYGLSLRELLGDIVPQDTRMAFMHDVNCALLGELLNDPASTEGNVALVTLGTGLGFTHAVNGKVQIGKSGSPAQGLWDAPYKDGILEDYVSRRGIIRLYKESGGELQEGMDVKEIADLARGGDAKAAGAFREAGRIFGTAAKGILAELDIRKVLFGGNISRSFDLIEPGIREVLGEAPALETLSDISGAVMRGAASLLSF